MAFTKWLSKKPSRATLAPSNEENDEFCGATMGGLFRSSFEHPRSIFNGPPLKHSSSFEPRRSSFDPPHPRIPIPSRKRASVESAKFKNLVGLIKYNQAFLIAWSNDPARRPTDTEVEACVTALINYIILKQYMDMADTEMASEWPGLWELLMALLKKSDINWVTRVEGLSRVPEGYYEEKAREEKDQAKQARKKRARSHSKLSSDLSSAASGNELSD